MDHSRLSASIAVLAFAYVCAIDTVVLGTDRRGFDQSIREPFENLLQLRNEKIQRRELPSVRNLEYSRASSDAERLTKRYAELTKRAIDVSGLKIPLIGDYFKFLNIPTFGQYYDWLNLPYIPFLNIGTEPETTSKFDIGPVNCTCKGKVCDCCLTAIAVCAHLESIPNAIGLNISVNLFGFPVFNTPIVLIEKPSFCFTLITLFDIPFQICIDLYNLNTLAVKNQACITIGFQKGTKRELNLNVGCVEIGFETFFSYKLPPNLDFIDIPILGFKQ